MLDALSLKNTKLGLETLELMGYDSDAITLRPEPGATHVGISPADSRRCSAAPPRCSCRATARSRGRSTRAYPIVLAHHSSEAAEAFRALAERLRRASADSTGRAEPDGRRRRFRRLGREA